LLGQYNSAETILIEIGKEYGESVWLIENKLLLAELNEGTESNWLLLSEMAKEIPDALLLYFVRTF
jgi:hypothetical protein